MRRTPDPRAVCAALLATTLLACLVAVARVGPGHPSTVPIAAAVAATAGRSGSSPSVRPLHPADLLLAAPSTLPATRLTAVRRLPGVTCLVPIDLGTVRLDHDLVRTAGVDPSAFRSFTPAPTADSDPLWRAIATGSLASSFQLGLDGRLPLGATLPATGPGRARVQLRIAAFATLGVPGVDAIVSTARAAQLGLPRGNAAILSAPSVDPIRLRAAIRRVLGTSVTISLLRPVITVPVARPTPRPGQPTAAARRPSTLPPEPPTPGPAPGSRPLSGAPRPASPATALSPAQLATVLAVARAQVGTPYVWGGVGPGGFDCSGLVGYAFAAAGIELPRTAAQQFLTGPRIPLSGARPGDLVFWSDNPAAPGYVDHVGIYLGGGMMIHAPHSGTVVQVQPVYPQGFVAAVRVDPALVAQLGGYPWPR